MNNILNAGLVNCCKIWSDRIKVRLSAGANAVVRPKFVKAELDRYRLMNVTSLKVR